MATLAEDRRFVIENWNYLFGRDPTMHELNREVTNLQNGLPRSDWFRYLEKVAPEAAVTRLYKEVLGRDPDPEGMAYYSGLLRDGLWTRAQVREELANSPEALLKKKAPPGPTADEEDAKAYLDGVLRNYGLESLSDWAWEQIKAGHSPERVLQDLRETKEYKQRFKGMDLRRGQGYNAISEAEYLQYEQEAAALMRAAGLPAGFYDEPDDFARFIGGNVSLAELNARINDGYLAATTAPAEVRQQLKALFGITESGLAAYYLDPDKALPLLQRQLNAAEASGAAVRTGYGQLTKAEALRLAELGVSPDEAEEGFGFLQSAEQLFGVLPGESGQAISRSAQQAAVFEGDADARRLIEKRQGARRSAGSGAQSFAVTNEGVAGLGRERR